MAAQVPPVMGELQAGIPAVQVQIVAPIPTRNLTCTSVPP
jgi:hypothetical protein